MNDSTLAMPLASDEWEVVCLLRDVPAGRSRRELLALLRQLVRFVAAPGCSEFQADGVPCPTAHSSCDECRRVDSCLMRIRSLMGPAEAGMRA